MARAKKKTTKKSAKKKDKAITLRLSFGERMNFSLVYPKETDILTGLILRDIKNKINLSQKEIKTLDAKRSGNGMEWQTKNDKIKNISFTTPEMEFLKSRVAELDKQKKVPQDFLEIALQIQDKKTE